MHVSVCACVCLCVCLPLSVRLSVCNLYSLHVFVWGLASFAPHHIPGEYIIVKTLYEIRCSWCSIIVCWGLGIFCLSVCTPALSPRRLPLVHWLFSWLLGQLVCQCAIIGVLCLSLMQRSACPGVFGASSQVPNCVGINLFFSGLSSWRIALYFEMLFSARRGKLLKTWVPVCTVVLPHECAWEFDTGWSFSLVSFFFSSRYLCIWKQGWW